MTAVANDTTGAAGDDLPGGVQGEEVPKPPPANPYALRSTRSFPKKLQPVPWVCRRLHLAPGRPLCVVGYAGSGKTLLMADLALAASAPDSMPISFWGGISLERRGRVAIFDLEVGDFLTEQRLMRLATGHHVDLEAWDERLFVTCAPALSLLDEEAEQKLAEQLEGFTLALFDSLTMLLAGSDENSASVSKAIGILARVSYKTGCAIVVLHHEGKPPTEGQKEARFRGRGSSAIQGMWSSQWAVTPEGEGLLTLEHGKSHWGNKQPALGCQILDVGAFDEELGVTPGVRLEARDPNDIETVSQVQRPASDTPGLRRAMERVVDVLRAAGRLTRKDLDKALSGQGSGKSELKNKAVGLLVERRSVVRVTLNGCAWFALAGTPDGEALLSLSPGEGSEGESLDEETLSPGEGRGRGEGSSRRSRR